MEEDAKEICQKIGLEYDKLYDNAKWFYNDVAEFSHKGIVEFMNEERSANVLFAYCNMKREQRERGRVCNCSLEDMDKEVKKNYVRLITAINLILSSRLS